MSITSRMSKLRTFFRDAVGKGRYITLEGDQVDDSLPVAFLRSAALKTSMLTILPPLILSMGQEEYRKL